MADLRAIAHALGGEVSRNSVLAPTPGHSSRDRGTVITLSPGAPDGLVVHCHNGGQADALAVKDVLRAAGILPSRDGQCQRRELTREEKARLAAEAERRQQAHWREVARECRQRLAQALPADPGHPYLSAKRIAPERLWQDSRGHLLVPMCDAHGNLWNLQCIAPDGQKRFTTGARCQGLFWWAGKATDRLVIGEGMATVAAVRRATGQPVIAAMSASNLPAVAQSIRARRPNIALIFAVDDDATGHAKAEEAARAVGGILFFPKGTHHD